ncbi:molybdopterin-guanine dinucleotide biosynthesis protein MobB [Roseivirga sp. 4D4]|uniref:molybdopterin-guanine dinucleotide biosynthesis protein MobB n=1 Tax=Roseivirga sp. 4D4 TaxID=1889784 RepID=UPI001112F81B|nr:molybdopterin-guanine dinucleotide biosynthesis protein MobB [Roseivirga sp. 4D4]
MRRSKKIFSFVILVLLSISTVMAAGMDTDVNDKKTKRAKRAEAKRLIKEEKIRSNSDQLVQRLEAQDLVIVDDGVRHGSYPESGLVNFFRIEGDTLTFQRVGGGFIGTGAQGTRSFYKSQGLIQDIVIMERSDGRPVRAAIFYLDQITMDPMRALVYVFENRLEVRNDDGTGVEIRGKLKSIDQANVLEIGQNSVNMLFRSNPFVTPRGRSFGSRAF